jgi:hypothetical protein
MQTKIYKEDNGVNFGKWTDKVSKFMYFDSTKDILSKIQIPGVVADYGGANGNLKTFIPHAISIDIDGSKQPDIIDDILTHVGNYELIVVRYVLHYLNDYEVLQLFKTIKSNALIIQFTNEDLKSKYQNSQNEFKYFRTARQLKKLLPNCKEIYSKKYTIGSSFYKNRLNIDNAVTHKETLKAYFYEHN